jgi:hypothetical protein
MLFHKIRLSIVAMSAVVLITSCEKDDTESVSREVKVSYPEIILNGDEVVILPVGASYTDAGAIVKDDITGQESPLEAVSDNVNTAEPGLYLVIFTAANANGFETTVARKVAVTDVTGTIDRSGTYVRPQTGVEMIMEQLGEGVYKITNPGGAGVGVNTIVYMVETELGVYTAPDQPTVEGTTSLDEISFAEGAAFWRVNNAGYGTQVREFYK